MNVESFSDHHVHAAIHRIFTRMEYSEPPFSVSSVMEEMFPEVDVIGREMAEHAMLEVYKRPLGNGRRALIAYNEGDHHSTQRFSILHELSHWIFEFDCGQRLDGAVACGTPGRKPLAERRADYFAAEVLAPLWILDRHVAFTIYPEKDDPDATKDRDQRIQRLASKFNVSRICMRNRVFDLAAWRKIRRGR